MTNTAAPVSRDEVAVGALVHDIGKPMQRAGVELPEHIRNLESVLCPVFQGRYSHKHVLWTDLFLEGVRETMGSEVAGLRLDAVRDVAVFHHYPESAVHWLCAEGDRLSSAMDRRERDIEAEATGWDAFKKIPLQSILTRLDLGLGDASQQQPAYVPAMLEADAVMPGAVAPETVPRAYARLWADHAARGWQTAFQHTTPWAMQEALLAYSRRHFWAVPSSTMDQPDIGLHDHALSVAALASCLHAYHEAEGTLADTAAIKDRSRAKFRLLVGDVSGIQNAIFALAHQQTKGVNRVLRARSYLIGEMLETVQNQCLQALGLPPVCALQNAGGQFIILVANVAGVEAAIDNVRREVSQWLWERYTGELSLQLALGPAFTGQDLMDPGFDRVLSRARQTLQAEKQRPFPGDLTGVLALDFDDNGACHMCQRRPAAHPDPDDPQFVRCAACAAEAAVGRDLPHADAAVRHDGPPGSREAAMPDASVLRLLRPDRSLPRGWRGGWQMAGGERTSLPDTRALGAHVPRMTADAWTDSRYDGLADETAPGLAQDDIKTFAHLGRDALEDLGDTFQGRELLAVIKGDVDRLGQLMAHGLSGADGAEQGSATLGRYTMLSRLMDAFFSMRLPALLERSYPDTYTVYAGGDDFLLIAPWRRGLQLAHELNAEFRSFVGDNPNITLSVGIELVPVHQPLNRAAASAETRLERAKDGGRDRIGLLDAQALTWASYGEALTWADWLTEELRSGSLTTAFVFKLLDLDRQRRQAEAGDGSAIPMHVAAWRARFGYLLERTLRRAPAARREDLRRAVCTLMGLTDTLEPTATSLPTRVAATIALYRNR